MGIRKGLEFLVPPNCPQKLGDAKNARTVTTETLVAPVPRFRIMIGRTLVGNRVAL